MLMRIWVDFEKHLNSLLMTGCGSSAVAVMFLLKIVVLIDATYA